MTAVTSQGYPQGTPRERNGELRMQKCEVRSRAAFYRFSSLVGQAGIEEPDRQTQNRAEHGTEELPRDHQTQQ
jgi:hypothetical protein